MHLTNLFSFFLTATSSLTTASLLPKRQNVAPQLNGSPVPMSQNNTGNYPRATTADSNGLMIGAYNIKAAGQTILKTVQSTDSGQTWSDLGEVYRANTTTHDLGNEFPFFLPSGRLLYFYRDHDRVPPNGDFTLFRIQVSYSDDGGVTFKYLSTVEERTPSGVSGIWEPFVRLANDGTTLQCYYSSENSKADQDIIARTSTDGGASWSDAYVVANGQNTRDGMPGIAPLDDNGNLIAVFETNANGGRFVVSSVTSSDDGYTWGNRRRVYTPPGSNTNAGSPQALNVGGNLVVSFNTDEDKASPGGKAGYSGGAAKIIVSSDGGATWGAKTTIFESGSNWPGEAQVSGSEVLVMTGVSGQGAVAQNVKL